MIEQLSEMQTRLHHMRDALLKEDSVMPEEEYIITDLEAKKKVLWYLDCVAAAVAGAHRHLSNMEHDDILSATERVERQKQIIERLNHDLGWLPVTIKDWSYCLHKHFEKYEADELPLPLTGHTREDLSERRQRVSETLDQLELLDREVDDMLGMLDAHVA